MDHQNMFPDRPWIRKPQLNAISMVQTLINSIKCVYTNQIKYHSDLLGLGAHEKLPPEVGNWYRLKTSSTDRSLLTRLYITYVPKHTVSRYENTSPHPASSIPHHWRCRNRHRCRHRRRLLLYSALLDDRIARNEYTEPPYSKIHREQIQCTSGMQCVQTYNIHSLEWTTLKETKQTFIFLLFWQILCGIRGLHVR